MQNAFRLGALAGLVLVTGVSAQNTNLIVKSQLKTRGFLSGCWGYSHPDGSEFAIVGAQGGNWVVETTDPANPVEVGWQGGAISAWRDVKMIGSTVYSVSEHHRGIRIFDLSNPRAQVYKGKLLEANITSSHTLGVDPDRKLLFINGTNLGMVICDVSSPFSPRIVGRYRSRYIHDSYSRRGKTYGAEIGDGRVRIMDTSNPARIQQISAPYTPQYAAHNIWVTDDDQLLCVTDESSSNGYVTFFDISDPRAPVQKGIYFVRDDIVHNAFFLGRVCYMAYYGAGLHVADVEDPDNPVKLASYDTNPTTGNFHGAWDVYPFSDSGALYVSDVSEGLFVFEMPCGHLNRYGAPTVPAGRAVPHVRFEGAAPRVNARGLELRIRNLQPNAPYALVISAAKSAPQSVLGVTVHIDLSQALWVHGRADANGDAVLPAPIPNQPGLAGARFYMQLFGADPQGTFGFTASRGMWSGICR